MARVHITPEVGCGSAGLRYACAVLVLALAGSLTGCGGGAAPAGGGGAGPVIPASYFNWGVETLKVDYGVNGAGTFDVQFFTNSTQDCTPVAAHTGNCGMRLDVQGNDGGNQQMGADTIQPNPDYPFNIVGGQAVYYRWWMKIMPGFSWGAGSAKTKSSRVNAGAAQGYTGYVMSYGFLIGECDSSGCTLNDGSSNSGDSSLVVTFPITTMDDGEWHEYIVKVKPNTSATCTAPTNCDGELQAWVDGVSVGEYNGFKLHNNAANAMSERWGGWMVRPFFQLGGTASDGGTIYLDDFATDNAFNSSF